MQDHQYTPAATQTPPPVALGEPNCQRQIGDMYQSGTGLPVDDIQAIDWLLKAAVNWSKTGNQEKARGAWEQAAKIAPNNPRVQKLAAGIGTAGSTR